MLIVRQTQRGQVRQIDATGYVGEALDAVLRVERVQHAVIGAHVDGLLARRIDRRRVDDVPQQVVAVAQRAAIGKLKTAITRNIGRVVRTRHCWRRGPGQRGDLCGRGKGCSTRAIVGENTPAAGGNDIGGIPDGGILVDAA